MKQSIICLNILFFFLPWTFAQSQSFVPMSIDSIYYSGGHHFRYRGLDYESSRALKKMLKLDRNSDLYDSFTNHIRTKRWVTVLEIIGVGSIGATVDGFWVPESEVRPVPLLLGLVASSTSLLLWKKSRKQLRNFVDEYNHEVYDNYIQRRFMSSKIIPNRQFE